jgi:hypothetical protein
MLAGIGREPLFVDLERRGYADAERLLHAAIDQSVARAAQA